MIVGTNKVHAHEGKQYHIQVEDLGTQSACLEVRVYIGGAVLWRNRHRLSAYQGVQLLLPAIGVAGAGATYLLERSNVWEVIQVGGAVSAAGMYLILGGVVVALMFAFYWQFGRRQQSRHSH